MNLLKFSRQPLRPKAHEQVHDQALPSHPAEILRSCRARRIRSHHFKNPPTWASDLTHDLSISGDASGGRAQQYLIDSRALAGEDSEELWLFASSLTQADAFTGSILRADVEQ